MLSCPRVLIRNFLMSMIDTYMNSCFCWSTFLGAVDSNHPFSANISSTQDGYLQDFLFIIIKHHQCHSVLFTSSNINTFRACESSFHIILKILLASCSWRICNLPFTNNNISQADDDKHKRRTSLGGRNVCHLSKQNARVTIHYNVTSQNVL